MTILALINQNGEPIDIRFVPIDMCSYCDIDSLKTYIEIPDVLSHELILKQYYWKDEWKIRTSKPNKYYYWDITLEIWISNLEEAKKSKREEVNRLREQKIREDVRGISYNGNVFTNDETTRTNLNEALNLVNAGVPVPENFVFRTKNNINISFTGGDIKNLSALVLFYKNACYHHSWELKNQIDALSTVEEIEAFDINVGWP